MKRADLISLGNNLVSYRAGLRETMESIKRAHLELTSTGTMPAATFPEAVENLRCVISLLQSDSDRIWAIAFPEEAK